ncbi:MAG: hypothetical protein WCK48_02365 [bacterium]
MKIIKILGILILSTVVAVCIYFLSYLFVGSVLVKFVCCGDYPLGWYGYIHYAVSGIFFILVFWFLYPKEK